MYNYDNGIQSDPAYELLLFDAARVYDVEVGDDIDNLSGNGIVVAGRGNGVSSFYLEAFDSSLTSLGKRIGEHKSEGSVFDTAMVK